MPYATTNDGVKLYFEEAGSGPPVIFVHEFAGDHRSWEPQMRFFSRYFRAITYGARGYPPSDVPPDPALYSQDRARDDVIAVLDHLNIEKAHVVGLSMGGFATLHVGIAAPQRALSLVIAGCGYGAEPQQRESFRKEIGSVAQQFDTKGMADTAPSYLVAPARLTFQSKDPRGYRDMVEQMAEHSARGSANTLRGIQMQRPSLWDLVAAMRAISVPALIVSGDEDEACLEAALLMKRSIPASRLLMLPRTGHTINLEEPAAFNQALLEFFLAADRSAVKPPL
jgi:pimeloyl-ACP methyl ester carboxylesterase